VGIRAGGRLCACVQLLHALRPARAALTLRGPRSTVSQACGCEALFVLFAMPRRRLRGRLLPVERASPAAPHGLLLIPSAAARGLRQLVQLPEPLHAERHVPRPRGRRRLRRPRKCVCVCVCVFLSEFFCFLPPAGKQQQQQPQQQETDKKW